MVCNKCNRVNLLIHLLRFSYLLAFLSRPHYTWNVDTTRHLLQTGCLNSRFKNVLGIQPTLVYLLDIFLSFHVCLRWWLLMTTLVCFSSFYCWPPAVYISITFLQSLSTKHIILNLTLKSCEVVVCVIINWYIATWRPGNTNKLRN